MDKELGTRVTRAIVMENSGSPRRRLWWVVSAAVCAMTERTAAA